MGRKDSLRVSIVAYPVVKGKVAMSNGDIENLLVYKLFDIRGASIISSSIRFQVCLSNSSMICQEATSGVEWPGASDV